jgi:hypothetical protein
MDHYNIKDLKEYKNNELYCFIQDDNEYSNVIKIENYGNHDEVYINLESDELIITRQFFADHNLKTRERIKYSNNVNPKLILCDANNAINIMKELLINEKNKIKELCGYEFI